MLTLYEFPGSGNCFKIELVLSQLGIPFARKTVDIMKGESRTPGYLALNPNGRVPMVVLDDGRVLTESNAIIWYFADGTKLLSSDRFERAQTLSWMFFEQYNHEPNIATSRFWLKYAGAGDEKAAALAEKKVKGLEALGVMEQRLAPHPFLVGDTYSIADVALFAYSQVADEGGFDLSPFPAVCAWLDRVRATPGFVKMAGT